MPGTAARTAARPAAGTADDTSSHLPNGWLWRALGVGVAAIFTLRLTYFLLQDVAEGRVGHVAERLFNEATGALLAALPLAGTFWLARRLPLRRPLRRGTVPAFVAAFAALSLTHTTAIIALRAWLGPRIGLSDYEYDFTAARYGYETANDVVFFIATVALLALTENVLAQRERERHAAALERSLLRAELSNLRLQLQPHFLFNALNTISSTMYEDVDAADALLGQLAGLLRTSLRTSQAHEVTVRDELQLLEQYAALMRARFGAALTIEIARGDGVEGLLVPSMVLQPLVENAVRHGGVARLGRGCVHVAVRRVDEAWLELRVHDAPSTVRGPIAIDAARGTGLAVTARRLRLLYGDAHALSAGATDDGGFAVALRLPARTAAAASLEPAP